MNNYINYFDIPFKYSKNNINDKSNLSSPIEALSNGTIFKREYIGYKNYEPRKLIINNSEEGLKRAVQAYYFAINDLTLYLDVHPEDHMALNFYNELVRSFNQIKLDYIQNNGPLTIYSKEEQNFTWNKMWPWEGRTL